MLQTTKEQRVLRRPADERLEALRDSASELLSMDEPRKRFGGFELAAEPRLLV